MGRSRMMKERNEKESNRPISKGAGKSEEIVEDVSEGQEIYVDQG